MPIVDKYTVRIYIFLTIMGFGFIPFLAGCGDKQENKDAIYYSNDQKYLRLLELEGMLGNHQLAQLKAGAGSFEMKGSVFFWIGSISGSNPDTLRFAWVNKNQNRVIMSRLPLDIIMIEVDDARNNPVIRFKFNIRNSPTSIKNWVEDNSKPNPNQLINRSWIEYATVSISSEDLEKEIYLPYFGEK